MFLILMWLMIRAASAEVIYDKNHMLLTGTKISISPFPSELKHPCLSRMVNVFRSNVIDFKRGGTWMANGQAFGFGHKPMVPLDDNISDLVVSITKGNDNILRIKATAATFDKKSKLKVSIPVFEESFEPKACESKNEYVTIPDDYLFSMVSKANRNLEERIQQLAKPEVKFTPGASKARPPIEGSN